MRGIDRLHSGDASPLSFEKFVVSPIFFIYHSKRHGKTQRRWKDLERKVLGYKIEKCQRQNCMRRYLLAFFACILFQESEKESVQKFKVCVLLVSGLCGTCRSN